MTGIHFHGFIKDIQYRAFLGSELERYSFDGFDINRAKGSGVVEMPHGELAFSKWISPKRTRSYPFARIYDTFNAPFRATIIPILKDEGADGDLDMIQFSTVSWMSLLNIYIVLSYYSDAVQNFRMAARGRRKITGQRLDFAHVNSQLLEISRYKQSALHWNRTLVESRFADILGLALDSYSRIESRTGVRLHDRTAHLRFLQEMRKDYERFKQRSLQGSKSAAQREGLTRHALEYLATQNKAVFRIENYLGGEYFLTADEVILRGRQCSIQEAKNSSEGFLPSLADIEDGLFKLVLFSNLDALEVNGRNVEFISVLKLTSPSITSRLVLPCASATLDEFLRRNTKLITPRTKVILSALNQEANANRKLRIEVERSH